MFSHCLQSVSSSVIKIFTYFLRRFERALWTSWRPFKVFKSLSWHSVNHYRTVVNFVFTTLWKRSKIPSLHRKSVLPFESFQNAFFHRAALIWTVFRALCGLYIANWTWEACWYKGIRFGHQMFIFYYICIYFNFC